MEKPHNVLETHAAKLANALTYHRQGNLDQAEAIYKEVLQSQPQHFNALQLLATLTAQRKNFAAAVELFDQVLRIQPNHANSLYNRGLALQDLKRYEEALKSYDRAISVKPDIQVFNNRGNVLRELQRYTEALASYDQALRIESNHAETLNNRGNALQALKRHAEALESYARALAINPNYVSAHFNRSLCQLLIGDFAHGWHEYAWRWKKEPETSTWKYLSKPLWTGKQVGRLLVWGEQGMGDQILHLSMLPDLACQGSPVTVAVEPRLIPLVQRAFPSVKTVALGPALEQEPYDYHLPMGNLGQHFRTRWHDFPTDRRAYLMADPARASALRKKVTAHKPLVCGISWFSKNPAQGQDKSLRLADLTPLFNLPHIQFVDLQYGDTGAERRALQTTTSVDLMHLDEVDNFNDIDALAALIQACDVIVTISNTTAHIAGALGKPVYLMLPYSSGLLWYWHENRPDSPWYPSARLFRQRQPGDWADVLASVTAALANTAIDDAP